MPVLFAQPLGDRERNRGLADAAGADDRNEATVRQLGGDRAHDFGAVEHGRDRDRQIVPFLGGRAGSPSANRVTGATKR